MPIHNVLWTAGWDSTFRVADLVLNHRQQVQPHYVNDWHRGGTPHELRAQERIRQAIADLDPRAGELLLPTKVYDVDRIPAAPEAQARFDRLRRKWRLGGQYDWLSRLANAEGIADFELSIHSEEGAAEPDGELPGLPNLLDGRVEKVGTGPEGSYALTEDLDDPDMVVFRPFRFPLLDTTKPEMGARAQAAGFGHVMELTWFCHSPTFKGEACGYCTPCKYTRQEGLGRRVPEATTLGRVEHWLTRKTRFLYRLAARRASQAA